MFAVGAICTVASSLVAAGLVDTATVTEARQGLASGATALFVAAALAYLLRWKVCGEAPVALVGMALLVYGGLLGVFSPIALTMAGEPSAPTRGSGLLRALVSAVAISLLLRSLSTSTIDSRLRPGRLLAGSVLAVGLGFAGVVVVLHVVLGTVLTTQADVVLHVIVTAGWIAVAVLFVRRAARRLQGDVLWVGLALGCVAVSNGVRAASLGRSASGLLAATALGLFAGGVALFGTSLSLSQLLAGLGAERLRLRADLSERDLRDSRQATTRDKRLHDVRSTLAAIRCAAGTLQRFDDRLESEQREALQSAVSSELRRLEELIDPTPAMRAVVLSGARGSAQQVDDQVAHVVDVREAKRLLPA